eukprot:GGOE01055814.1.p1 GENE.GGOE01055814.1~~GGOE01055814.1.p1  ORF type:complete len:256 (-),score=31.13 GGOE01055814.1:176-943(-)
MPGGSHHSHPPKGEHLLKGGLTQRTSTVISTPPQPVPSRADALIAEQLQNEEQELFLQAQRSAQKLSEGQDSEAFWSKLKEGTLATLHNVGDFFFPAVQIWDEVEVSADRERLLQRLAFHGLKETLVEGDGNCQFRALADQLWRNQHSHREVRHLVTSRLKFHSNQYAPFVINEDYDTYVARMSKEGEWGDHLTLQAASDAFNVEVVLITSFADNRSIISIKPMDWGNSLDGKSARQTLYLSFFAEIHYNSIDVR